METNITPVTGDTADIQFLLNMAQWEVGVLIVPSTEPCTTPATDDDSEVR